MYLDYGKRPWPEHFYCPNCEGFTWKGKVHSMGTTVRKDWTLPEVKCRECGEIGKPVLLVEGPGMAAPVLNCECGTLWELAEGQLEWPFEGPANARDFEGLGFEVVWL